MTPADGGIPKQPAARIEELVQIVNALPSPVARNAAVELLRAAMDLHAAALQRILEIAAAHAPAALDALAADELISSVLVLHGLHPDDLQTRLSRAIGKLERFFDSRGGGIELLGSGPERVRIRFTGNPRRWGAAARETIENALYEAAPEIAEVIVEGVEDEREPGFVPVSSLLAAHQA